MGRVNDRRAAYFLFLLTGFLSGLLLGTTLVTTYMGYKLDKSYEQVNSLQIAVKEKDDRLEKLEESINTKKFIIKKIEVVLQFEGDALEKTFLIKYIKDRYYSLLGKEVSSIDPDLISEVIDHRIVRVSSRDYKLVSFKIVVSDVLKVWVTAAELKV
jgi:hypothetical protein